MHVGTLFAACCPSFRSLPAGPAPVPPASSCRLAGASERPAEQGRVAQRQSPAPPPLLEQGGESLMRWCPLWLQSPAASRASQPLFLWGGQVLMPPLSLQQSSQHPPSPGTHPECLRVPQGPLKFFFWFCPRCWGPSGRMVGGVGYTSVCPGPKAYLVVSRHLNDYNESDLLAHAALWVGGGQRVGLSDSRKYKRSQGWTAAHLGRARPLRLPGTYSWPLGLRRLGEI